MESNTDAVLKKLAWMEEERIWPNGLRYLWTDAFGVVLLVSLYTRLHEERFLVTAKHVVDQVDRVLGRKAGYRIGEAPDRDGQYYHYLGMWIFALGRLGEIDPEYKEKAIAVAKAIHPKFLVPDVGVIWKMQEDLSGPYPGYGLGALDAFHGYVVYSWLDANALAAEIQDMRNLVDKTWRTLRIDQDLGLGMMLWMSHFKPKESWAIEQRDRSLKTLDGMWIDPPGYFCRHPGLTNTKFAFTNYGASMGLQSVDAWPELVKALNRFFETYRSGDEYDREAITHVMGCVSVLPGGFIVRAA
jgi:hypothetical protein